MLTEGGLERQKKLRWAVQRTDDDRMDHVRLLLSLGRAPVKYWHVCRVKVNTIYESSLGSPQPGCSLPAKLLTGPDNPSWLLKLSKKFLMRL